MTDIIGTLRAAGKFKTFVKAIEKVGLVDSLKSAQYTVFAPTDDAFNALPKVVLNSLLKDIESLKQVVSYHVVYGKFERETFLDKMLSYDTLQGQKIKIDSSVLHLHVYIKVNDATITDFNIGADNGVIHEIDSVLLPL